MVNHHLVQIQDKASLDDSKSLHEKWLLHHFHPFKTVCFRFHREYMCLGGRLLSAQHLFRDSRSGGLETLPNELKEGVA